ncbi:MAG: hypothetical protein ACRD0D_08220 [Acidimicrobiales bacterium]
MRSKATGGRRRWRSSRGEAGASLVEYALLMGLIALAAFAALRFMGSSLGQSLSQSGSRLFP